MGAVIQDLKYGLRILAKNPGFTAVAVLTLALGIGANAAIFSVVNAVLLRPLPYPDSNRLVSLISTVLRTNREGGISYPDFTDWRKESTSFEAMGAFRGGSVTLTGQGEPLHVEAAAVSAQLFALLGVKPALGRAFLPGEDSPGAVNGADAVILSHGLWQRRFGADEGVVGRTVQIDSSTFTVIGVMPAGFQFPPASAPAELWTTMAVDAEAPGGGMTTQRGAHYLEAIARLKPGVGPPQAQAEMNAIVRALNWQYPENMPRGIKVVPLQDRLVRDFRPALWVLLGAVGCLLLIVCANVANLLLARATARQKEMAIRAALGAGRARAARQLLTESLLLGFCGGGLGLLAGLWGVAALARLIPKDVSHLAAISLDGRLLGFTAVISILASLLFGLAPAIQVSRLHLTPSLQEGGRGGPDGLHRNRLRAALVAGEVALASMLLIAAALLIQSFLRLESVYPGFDSHAVLTFRLDLPHARYPAERQTGFYQQLVTRLESLPGVRSAAAAWTLPSNMHDVSTSFEVEGQPVPQGQRPSASYNGVEPGYFRSLGIAHLRGRGFTWRDNLKSVPVAIVNQTLADRFLGGENPVGKHITPGIGNGYSKPPVREIVGVVENVRAPGSKDDSSPQIYVPLAQSPLDSVLALARTSGEPQDISGAARSAVAELDKDLPVYQVETLDEYSSQAVAQPRLISMLLGVFAGLALALAVVGVYGVVSYSVERRTHEIGVRMALGAKREDVLRLILKQGFRLVLVGVALGIIGALALTRFLSSLLYRVKPTDPLTYVVVVLILSSVAAAASYIPARRATKVDPMEALRYE